MLSRSLSDSERRLLVRAGIVTAIVAVLVLVDLPLYRSGTRMATRAVEEQQRLTSIVSMGQDYLSVKAELDDIRATAFTGGGASLAGIDAIVGKLGLKKKLASVKAAGRPVGEAEGMKAVKAEMSLERISLAELSGLIGALEADGHPLAIERIAIKAAFDDPSVFHATVIVNTVEREDTRR